MTDIADISDRDIESNMPKPVGYRLLIALPSVEEKFASGLLKADMTKHQETILSMVGLVLDMGQQAYADTERFPTGPWCAVGDYVLFRSNSGTRFRYKGIEYRLLNDDSIEAVVSDPSTISRA